MKALIESGVAKERILYINFEDERLLPFGASDFQLLLDTYYSKFPSLKDSLCHLFLDEVQRIEGWEMFIRRVLDTERMDVCVTGSSSRLLSREIATSLRGRSLSAEIFPFSFREFLRASGVEPDPVWRVGSRRRALFQHHASRYVELGGFPEVGGLEPDVRRQVLRGYVDVVILRDVVERHGVGNTAALRALIRRVLHAPATRLSLNKFHNELRSQGIVCAKNSLYDFLEYLTDAFLLFEAPICSPSENKRRANPRKVFAVDSGLLEAMSLHFTGDRGAILDNLVFMHLRREGFRAEYYVTRSGGEVDFVIRGDTSADVLPIQVCWEMGRPETARREVRALRETMDELGVNRGLIVTWADEAQLDERIAVVPAWRWLASIPDL